jgi:hypothetical protein
MTIVLNGTTGITNDGGYTGDGVVFADTTPANTLVTTTGGNVGIGTSSPAYKLDVSGQITTRGSIGALVVQPRDGSGAEWSVYNPTGDDLRFFGNSDDRMVLTNSGNLGLGVTPSAWASSVKALELPTGAFYSFASGSVSNFYSLTNAYLNGAGSPIYKQSSFATQYLQTAGQHQWYTAPSGTAGNAISFTQVLTVAADGKATSTAVGVDNNFTLNSTAGAYSTTLTLAAAGGGGSTINATGASSDYLRFTITGSERARIDSSGNLLVGTTTSSARLTVQADSSVVQPVVFNTTASGTGATSLVRFRRNGTNVGEIEVTGSATTYATSSDYRLKENVQPMTGALAKVQALKPVAYKWKIDGSSGEGFIAHELQEFCPDAVTGEKDAVDAEGNPKYQGIDTSFLVATLTAAIQEQQAIITALTARVEALEGTQP